ncbi:hypothetical protein BGP_5637 [Beggiatoa sp. PS]|nr:hypothetical protein BGP_5637 [Beggiatoa sp. PS]
MPSKFKSNPKHIIWQLSFISLIFISLVHCTTKVAEQHPPINQPSLPQNAISSQTSLPVVQNTTAVLPTIVPAVRNRPQNPNAQDFITQPIQNSPSVIERDNSLLSNIEICDSGSRIEIDISEQQLELFCRYQGNEVTKSIKFQL